MNEKEAVVQLFQCILFQFVLQTFKSAVLSLPVCLSFELIHEERPLQDWSSSDVVTVLCRVFFFICICFLGVIGVTEV